MQYSASNATLWNSIVQFGIISCALLVATLLRRKLPFVRQSLLPTSVLAGFLLLLARNTGVLHLDTIFLETLTYHGIAVGFIAMSLRVPRQRSAAERSAMTGAKSGALIVSCYLVQALIGLAISFALSYTVMPGLFKASGILLPMGYGQGPGQANNIGTSYEALGFTGGRSFALSLAAAGYLCACVVGVLYLNLLRRRGLIRTSTQPCAQDAVTVDDFQDCGEIPVAESIDRFSMQVVMVLAVYLATYLVSWGVDAGLSAIAPGLGATLSPILWGFNFIVGSLMAIGLRSLFTGLKKTRIMTRQYQNNYLLSRISGVAFDLMIVAGIASINIEDLSGLWIPFLLMAAAGGIVTLLYLQRVCRRIYPDYYYEGLTSMYGMLTGTISSGVLLLRELDPGFETPAANNLVLGSGFGIAFGAPMLLLIGMAPKSDASVWLVFGLAAVYLALLLLFLCKAGKTKNKQED